MFTILRILLFLNLQLLLPDLLWFQNDIYDIYLKEFRVRFIDKNVKRLFSPYKLTLTEARVT